MNGAKREIAAFVILTAVLTSVVIHSLERIATYDGNIGKVQKCHESD